MSKTGTVLTFGRSLFLLCCAGLVEIICVLVEQQAGLVGVHPGLV